MKALLAIIALTFSVMTHAQDAQTRDANAIKALIESATLLANADLSCDLDFDCEVVAIGARACGGPSSYIVTSKNNLNLNEVEFIALKTQEKQREFNRNYGRISICSIVMPPQTKCVKNLCK